MSSSRRQPKPPCRCWERWYSPTLLFGDKQAHQEEAFSKPKEQIAKIVQALAWVDVRGLVKAHAKVPVKALTLRVIPMAVVVTMDVLIVVRAVVQEHAIALVILLVVGIVTIKCQDKYQLNFI